MSTKSFYVYEYVNPFTDQVFYVGKGSGRRAYYHLNEIKRGRSTKNLHKDNTIKKIIASGLEPIIQFKYVDIPNEAEAYDLEEKLQLSYRLENLTNLVIGS